MGGNAVPGVGTIHRIEISPTLRKIEEQLGFKKNYFNDRLLGSTGKKDYSGDIDIVLDPISHNDMKVFSDNIRDIYGQNNVRRSGTMFNIAIPIEEFDVTRDERLPRTGTVQVDFIFADKEYTKLFNFSPGDASLYKGVHRNLSISAIAGYTDRKVSDELDGFGRPVETVRWKFSPAGFFKICRKSRKDAKGQWLKSQKDEAIGTPKTDPLLITEILFGDGAKKSDLDSVETIIDACKQFFDIEKQELIYRQIAYNIIEYSGRSKKVNLLSYSAPLEVLRFM